MAAADAMKQNLKNLRSSELSIGEKFKKLNQFVKSARTSFTFEEAKALIQPVDYFSRRIVIELTIAFRNLNHFIHLLKTEENEVLRDALRKNSWFYSPDSQLTNPEFLVNELLPVISFSCRQIILTKIPIYLKDEERCEKIFEAVGVKYGFDKTGDLIVGCGPTYVLEAIKVRKLMLNNRQVNPLLKKHPKLVLDYLIEFYKSKTYHSTSIYNNVLQYIANSHPALLMSLIEALNNNYMFNFINLKLEASNRFLRYGKAKILAAPEKFTGILNEAGAYKQLTQDEFITLFASVWPATIQEYMKNGEYSLTYYTIPTWLEAVKTNAEKGEIIQKTYLRKYGVSLLENETAIPKSIMKYFPPDVRTKVAEAKIAKFKEDGVNKTVREIGDIAAYKSIDKSIPEIKEMLFHESDASTRLDLINNCLLDTCEINDDLTALAEVCKYYVTRHRNEQQDVHSRIIFKIADKFDLSKFTIDIWNAYIAVIQLYLVTEDESSYYMWQWNKVLEHLYVFLELNPEIKSSNPKLNELMLRLLKWKVSASHGYSSGNYETKEIQKRGVSMKGLVELVIKQTESLYSSKSKASVKPKAKKNTDSSSELDERVIIPLLNCFQEWNQEIRFKAPDQLLSVKNFPFLEGRIEEVLKNHKEFPSIESLILLLMKDPILKSDREMLRKYFEIYQADEMILYFLRRDATAIVKNWEDVQSSILTGHRSRDRVKFVELLKHHGYKVLTENLTKKCKAQLVDEDASQQDKENAIAYLSIIQATQDFLDSMASYLPKESKIDPEDVEDAATVNIRKRIAASLKNVEYASDGFPSLLKLCTGDYLKFTVGSLYSLSSKAEQSKALAFLKELGQRPVSVKKHAIRLICLISSVQDVTTFLKTLSETEQHATIRHVILFNLFKVSDASTWPVLKSIILGLGEKETDSLAETTKLQNIDRIPTELLEEYFTTLWKLFQDLKLPETSQSAVVQAIGQNQSRLSESYLKTFIKSHLFSPGLPDSVQRTVTGIFVEYILLGSSSASIDENLQILQQGLNKLPLNDFGIIQHGVQRYIRNHHLLENFVAILNTELESDDNKDKPFPEELFHELLKLQFFTQNPAQTFDKYLQLQILAIQQKAAKKKDYFTAGQEVAALLDTYINKYGKEIFSIFKPIWKARFMAGLQDPPCGAEATVEFISGLLVNVDTSDNSNEKKILAFKILPFNPAVAKGSEAENKFKRIVEHLFNSNDPFLQIQVNQWIQKSSRHALGSEDWNELFRGKQ